MLRLLTHEDFRVVRPQAGCAVCRRPFRRGSRHVSCARCGIELHGRCHWQRVASPEERGAHALLPFVLVLCHGCRS